MKTHAVVVNMRQRGTGQMAGLGDATSAITEVIDRATGGEYTRVSGQIDTLELLFKVSVAASVISAVCSLLALARRD
jgi:hypothetical protein